MSHLSPTSLDESFQRLTDQWVASGLLASKDHQPVLESTNSTATSWLNSYRGQSAQTSDEAFLKLPRLVLADVQTAGRGRLGRSWVAQRDGLAFSLVLPGCHELLSIAVGVAIAESIEHVAAPARCGLKWPNDVWMGGVKVAGTLIERVDFTRSHGEQSGSVAIVGIGINVGSSPQLEDAQATSINQATSKLVTRWELLCELIPTLIRTSQWCDTDADELLTKFRDRCVLTDELITCAVDGQVMAGRCLGVNERGEMRVQTESGERICRSGEVSRVRRV